MSSSYFRIAFDGDAFVDGEIDVRDLAPALLALGDVIQSANRALNGDRAQASLKMKATNRGSFEALLSVDISLIGALVDLLDAAAENPDRVVAANTLMDLLLKAGAAAGATGGATVGLFKALKWLGGKRPDRVETGPDGTTLIVNNLTSIIVDSRTLELLNDIPTRESVEKFGEKALGIPSVEAVRLGEPDEPEEVVLKKTDRAALIVPPPIDDAPAVEINEREVWLKIITSAFRDGYKWRFSDGGEKPFTADIEDTNFINALAEGKIALSANDTLRCLIREEQKLGAAGLTKETKVLRVLEHIPGPTQLKLL